MVTGTTITSIAALWRRLRRPEAKNNAAGTAQRRGESGRRDDDDFNV